MEKMVNSNFPIRRMEMFPEENRLVRQARSGDVSVFAQLYDLYIERVYRYVYFLATDDALAEKITSRVFIVAWQQFDRYQASGSLFVAWLYKIARTQAAEHYRTHKRNTTPRFSFVLTNTSQEPDLVSRSRALDKGIRNMLDLQAVRAALQFLTEEQQQILILNFIDSMPTRDIARTLSKRESALQALVTDALQALASQMEKRGIVQISPEPGLDENLLQSPDGASRLDDYLTDHPEHADQLKHILRTVVFLNLGRDVKPQPAFIARTRTNLTEFLRFNPRRASRAQIPAMKRAAVTLAMLGISLFITGTAYAQAALPGDQLYGWKISSEQVWRAVSLDPLGTDLAIANRRAAEWVAVADDPQRNVSAMHEYFNTLHNFESATNVDAYSRIVPVLQSQQRLLADAGLSSPQLDHYLIVAMAAVPPTAVPQVNPTATATAVPTRFVPSPTRTRVPPTSTPVPPTFTPTDIPTATPSPTSIPTSTPTDIPTATPTDEPTSTPTDIPPTSTPTEIVPTPTPTDIPTDIPPANPTDVPPAGATNVPGATP